MGGWLYGDVVKALSAIARQILKADGLRIT
jgi:hypothetical protein